MHIALEHPNQPELVALVQALDAYQTVLYPPSVERGCTLLILETGARQPEALGLYVRCGYLRRGRSRLFAPSTSAAPLYAARVKRRGH